MIDAPPTTANPLLSKSTLTPLVLRYMTKHQEIPVSQRCDARRDWYIGDFVDWLLCDDVGGEAYRNIDFNELWNESTIVIDSCAWSRYKCVVENARVFCEMATRGERWQSVTLYTMDNNTSEHAADVRRPPK